MCIEFLPAELLWRIEPPAPSVTLSDQSLDCNGCGHKHRWAIDDLIADHKPWTTVAWLAHRWKCSKCGSRDPVPFAIGR
jgi:hypothetical protein